MVDSGRARAREAPLAGHQLRQRSRVTEAHVEVAAQQHRLARPRHAVDEHGRPQQLSVGQPPVDMPRRVEVPDEESRVAAPDTDGLTDPALLPPSAADGSGESEPARLGVPEAAWIEDDVPVLDDAELGG